MKKKGLKCDACYVPNEILSILDSDDDFGLDTVSEEKELIREIKTQRQKSNCENCFMIWSGFTQEMLDQYCHKNFGAFQIKQNIQAYKKVGSDRVPITIKLSFRPSFAIYKEPKGKRVIYFNVLEEEIWCDDEEVNKEFAEKR